MVFLSMFALVHAQKRVPDRGFKANTPFATHDLDAVNLTNGNLFISLPLASLPKGRGDSPDFPISLNYNSKLWDMRREVRFDGFPDENGSTKYFAETLVPAVDGGWTIGVGYRLVLSSRLDFEPGAPCDGSIDMQRNAYAFKLQLRFPDGIEHEFRPVGFNDNVGDRYYNVTPNGTVYQWNYSTVGDGSSSCSLTSSKTPADVVYYTADGSHLRLVVHRRGGNGSGADNSWSLFFPNGMMVENLPADDQNVVQRMTDRNGNRAYLKRGIFNGSEATIVEDDLGRQTILQSTLSGHSVFRRGFKGELLETRLEWNHLNLKKHYNSADVFALNASPDARNKELSQSFSVLRRITLPQQVGGLTYEFNYNGSFEPTAVDTKGWGELKSVRLPTGAEIEYRYLLDDTVPLSVSGDVLKNSVTKRILRFVEEADGKTTPASETQSYAIGADSSVFTDADGHATVTRFVSTESGSCDAGLVLSTRFPDGSMTENLWADRCFDPYVQFEFKTLADSFGRPTLTSATQSTRDRNGNLVEERRYGYVPYPSVYRVNGRPTGIAPDMKMMRATVNDYYNPTPVADGQSIPLDIRLRNALRSSELRDADGKPVARTEFEYDDTGMRGNLTAVSRWDSSKGALAPPTLSGSRLNDANSVSTKYSYDTFGNQLMIIDARGFQTDIGYGDVGSADRLYPTLRTEAARTSVALSAATEYDFFTGLPVSETRFGNSIAENISNHMSYDAAGRPLRREEAVGTSSARIISIEYDDLRRLVITRSDRYVPGDGNDVSIEHYDQLGRVRLQRTLELTTQDPFNEQDGIKRQFRYSFVGGSVYKVVSNPYRSPTSGGPSVASAMGWKVERTDRRTGLIAEEVFSGSVPPAPWGTNTASTGKATSRADADLTMRTDESGKRIVTRNDASGAVAEAWEIVSSGDATIGFAGETLRGFRTTYSHDAAGHLTGILQGAQQRKFLYDSLSRLQTATNPESGTVRYEYDTNGNLSFETDARGVSTRYVYDALNRVINRSYTTEFAQGYIPSPIVTYSYDDYRVPFSKGKLTRVHSSATDDRTVAFDAAGRITESAQITDGASFQLRYRFDLAGNLIEQSYPSGRKVRNTFGQDGRLSSVASAREGQGLRVVASRFVYDASGSSVGVRFGNGLWERSTFNVRGGLTRVTLGGTSTSSESVDISIGYQATADNGNVSAISMSENGSQSKIQSFQYDELNRITSAAERSQDSLIWRQAFNYDRFGNRRYDEIQTTTLPRNCLAGFVQTVCASDRKRLNPSLSNTDNKPVRDQDGDGVDDFRVDSSGNVLTDPTGLTFYYDSNHRQVQVEDRYRSLVSRYAYDGLGRRIKKTTYVNNQPDETTVFVYDAFSKVVAEYSDKVAPESSSRMNYLLTDQLGSVRAVSDQYGRIASHHDYFPFGGEIERAARGGDNVRARFAGYERDYETSLDYAGARYYSYTHGRFTSPDPLLSSMDVGRPQSLNRYSFVMNNPLKYVDPRGEDWIANTGGDRAKNPYKWVDKCASGQACWTSVAHDTASGVQVYGTLGPKDVTFLAANSSGQMNMEVLLSHHDSRVRSVAMSQGIPEPYLSTKAAASLYNLGIRYHKEFPKDSDLIFANGNTANGKPCVYPDGRSCHSGHRGGDMDLRYMDSQGGSLTGSSASVLADPRRIRFIVNFMRSLGFPESYSGNSDRLGTNPASGGTARLHRNHLHIGIVD